jgi:hypothetical protein
MLYDCFFQQIRLHFPFSNFQVEILNRLDIAPSQVHPNAWGFIIPFKIFCWANNWESSSNHLLYLFSPTISRTLDSSPSAKGKTTFSSNFLKTPFQPSRMLISRSRIREMNFHSGVVLMARPYSHFSGHTSITSGRQNHLLLMGPPYWILTML